MYLHLLSSHVSRLNAFPTGVAGKRQGQGGARPACHPAPRQPLQGGVLHAASHQEACCCLGCPHCGVCPAWSPCVPHWRNPIQAHSPACKEQAPLHRGPKAGQHPLCPSPAGPCLSVPSRWLTLQTGNLTLMSHLRGQVCVKGCGHASLGGRGLGTEFRDTLSKSSGAEA